MPLDVKLEVWQFQFKKICVYICDLAATAAAEAKSKKINSWAFRLRKSITILDTLRQVGKAVILMKCDGVK